MLPIMTRRCFAAAAALGLAARPAAAQAAPAVLGNFGGSGPQNFGKATGSFQQAFGDRARAQFVDVSSGAQIITAMAANSLDLCNIGSSPMVVSFAQRLKISMVYVQKVITDSECLVARKGSGIRGPQDLAGRTVGLPLNTSAHFAMLAMLKSAGVAPGSVRIVNMRPDTVLAAWRRKDIDASYIWYPVIPDLLANDGEIVFRTGDLAAQGTLVFDGIVVRNAFKERYPELVLAYLREYQRLAALYVSDPAKVIDVMAPFLSAQPAAIEAYIKSFHPVPLAEIASDKWMGLPDARDTGVLRTLREQGDFLKESDQITSVPADYAAFVDSGFLTQMSA